MQLAQQRAPWRRGPRRSPRPRTSASASAPRSRDDPTRGGVDVVLDALAGRSRLPRARARPSLGARPQHDLAVCAAHGGQPAARSRRCRRSRACSSTRPVVLVDWPVNPGTPRHPDLEHAEASRRPNEHPAQGREVVIVEAVRTPIGRGHPEKGYYKDTHPNDLLGQDATPRSSSAPGIDARRGRGRHRRLRAAVRRAGLQRRAQRLAAGRAADRDAGDDGRPPVRLGPAGRELRRRADRRRRPRRRDRLGRRAHGPHPVRRRHEDAATSSAPPFPPELLEKLQPRRRRASAPR